MLKSLLQLYQKETPTQVLSCEYWKNFKNIYFGKHLRTAASEIRNNFSLYLQLARCNSLNSHNQNILRDQPQSTPKTCNCLKKEDCPMNGFCLTKSLLYYARITCDKENYTQLYKGICETTFKKRYANHKKSFNVPTYKNDAKLSTEYWALKTKQLNPKVSWQIKRRCNSYNPISRKCNLCLNEKLEIQDDQDKNLSNKRSEIISHCRHQNKFKLKTLAGYEPYLVRSQYIACNM